MAKLALLARMEAKPGKEKDVEQFLASALPLARKEAGTTTWFALKLGPGTFGIYDTFDTEAARQAHLDGPIAQALMARAEELLTRPPTIDKVDVLADTLKD
jgi:quinol monooxygenase YgiN